MHKISHKTIVFFPSMAASHSTMKVNILYMSLYVCVCRPEFLADWPVVRSTNAIRLHCYQCHWLDHCFLCVALPFMCLRLVISYIAYIFISLPHQCTLCNLCM